MSDKQNSPDCAEVAAGLVLGFAAVVGLAYLMYKSSQDRAARRLKTYPTRIEQSTTTSEESSHKIEKPYASRSSDSLSEGEDREYRKCEQCNAPAISGGQYCSFHDADFD